VPTIRFAAPFIVFDFQTTADGRLVEDPDELRSLEGLEYDEIFSDYFERRSTLVDAGITGGLLRFKYNEKTQRLDGVTEYSLSRPLTAEELALLSDYTIGQWSDGIGENFFCIRLLLGPAPQFDILDHSVVKVEQRD
jgi:hypothetical protein